MDNHGRRVHHGRVPPSVLQLVWQSRRQTVDLRQPPTLVDAWAEQLSCQLDGNQVSHWVKPCDDRPRRRTSTRWLYGPRPDQPLRRTATLGHRPSTSTAILMSNLSTVRFGRTASSHSFAKSPTSAPSRVAEPAGADIHLGLSENPPSFALGGETADSFLPSLAIQTGGRSIRKD